MTNTPLIPIPFDTDDEIRLVAQHELDNSFPAGDLPSVLEELIRHSDGDNLHMTRTLDWAMQIRSLMKIEWKDCIHVAMTLYFG